MRFTNNSLFSCARIKGVAIAAILLLSGFTISAQQTTSQRLTHLEAGYLLGGSGDGFFFVLDHGFAFTMAHGARWGGFSLLGGASYQVFLRSNHVPIFLEAGTALGKRGKGNFRLRLGYSLAQSQGPAEAQEYRLKGGWMVAPAYGLNLFNGSKGQLQAWLGYNYHRATLRFKPFGSGQAAQSALHFHLFSLKMGYTFFHAPKIKNDLQ